MAKHSAEAKALADLIARKTNEQAPTQMARARELARIIIPRAGRLPANVLRDACPSSKHLAQIRAWISGERASSGG